MYTIKQLNKAPRKRGGKREVNTMNEQEIKERIESAEQMGDILVRVPDDKRDLARLALTFYTSGISAGLALNAAPTA